MKATSLHYAMAWQPAKTVLKTHAGGAQTMSPEPKTQPPEQTNHRYFGESMCQDMPTACVSGCSYNHQDILKAGAGIVWFNDYPCSPQPFQLGPDSSLAAILITLHIAMVYNIKELVICTVSIYALLSFTCHLPGWKWNRFKTSNNKSVKDQDLFKACDVITTRHDVRVYWKKVRGHS